MESPILSSDDLKNAKEFVSFQTEEVCGTLSPHEGGILYIETYSGAPEDSRSVRKSCQLKKLRRYIWHTHPYASKGYPSVEDILRVIKKHRPSSVYEKNEPITSIVFTRWGIWEISWSSKLPISKEDKQYRFLVHNLSKVGHRLYFASDEGRSSRPPLDMIERFIVEVKKTTERIGIDLDISFSVWTDTPYRLRYT